MFSYRGFREMALSWVEAGEIVVVKVLGPGRRNERGSSVTELSLRGGG